MATITKKQSITKPLSDQEKLLYGAGTILLLGGSIVWYIRSQKNKDQDTATNYGDTNTYDNTTASNGSIPTQTPTAATPPIVYNGIESQPEAPVVREAEKFGFKIGQTVMAKLVNGTPTYVPRKLANNNYATDGTIQTKFKVGDPIGTIVWVGKLPNNTYRYVVKRIGKLGAISFHWIADTKHIAPYGKNLGTFDAIKIDKNKLLKMGSKGLEVKTLQILLKIKPDGDFGKNTKNALNNQKKLFEIRLKDWK